jgi:transketolase
MLLPRLETSPPAGEAVAAGDEARSGAGWLLGHLEGASPACQTLATAAAILVLRHLCFDPADAHWADRDRIVVSPGLQPLGALIAASAGVRPEFALAADPGGECLGAAVGLAMAERSLAARFGRSLVDHRTWVLASEEDLVGGHAQEAAAAAAALRLGRLTVLAGFPESAPFPAAFASHWTVRRAAADDEAALHAAMSAAMRSHKPTLIACIGRPSSAGLGAPRPAVTAAIGGRGTGVRRAWLRRLARHTAREEFERTMAARLPPGWHGVFSEPWPWLPAGQAEIAPRAACRQALTRLSNLVPELACLPADQTGGTASFPWQNHVQALACALVGMAGHGGVLPIGQMALSSTAHLGTALRAAAQGGLRTVYLVAEPATPCPTAGHRAALRAMRNVFVFRPADVSETLECAELALRRVHGPSVLLLSEVPCAPLADRPTRTRCVRGGFLLRTPVKRRDVTLIASGSELALALATHDCLAKRGIVSAVVSLPCWELFANQEQEWRDEVLGEAPRVGIESGSGFGWERWLGAGGVFVGTGGDDECEAVTAERIVAAVHALVGAKEGRKAF